VDEELVVSMALPRELRRVVSIALPRELVDAPSLETFKVRGSKQPDLVEDIPAHCICVGLDGS